MKLFLAGAHAMAYAKGFYIPYRLESFYTFRDVEKLPECKEFLLDSGAFTFMKKKATGIDWEDYVDRYADFILRHGVEHFIELDIDKVVGLSRVERLRKRLEERTGRKCIPVWHKSRGKQYWLDLIEEYPRVAIGGLAIKDIKPSQYPFLHWFIETAHRKGVQVHGLGFTSLRLIEKFSWDSVDSTTWLNGGRYGEIFYFDGTRMKKYAAVAMGKRMKLSYEKAGQWNLSQWLRYVAYLEGK